VVTNPSAPSGSPNPARRTPKRPASSLAERWTNIDGVDVFYRESADPPPDAPTIVHLHGFGLSGRYLLPTAERLAGEFHTLVPDLPGFGLSWRAPRALDVPGLARTAADFLDDRDVASATLVGNSMGCPVICEFAYEFPERVDRAVLVSPAGGKYNQPLIGAMTQLARDGAREPSRMMRVAVPDYLRFGIPSTARMFRALTKYPTLERLLALRIPTLVVIGDRDPLMPPASVVREVAAHASTRVVLVVIEGAAHAINFSHPDELANIIRLFMADEPIVDDPDAPGVARAIDLSAVAPETPAEDAEPGAGASS
jgi:pimeloyl-ACP methyl ester carboxylesterase